MFKTLFSYPGVIQHHRDGPLAAERATYLESLVAKEAARGTLLRRARYCLCVAKELEKWPRNHSFSDAEIEALATAWAADRVANARASAPRWPQESFRLVAFEFIDSMGRLLPKPTLPPGRYDRLVEDFIASQRQRGWQSSATCRSGHWQVQRYLSYLEDQALDLDGVDAVHVDAYFQHVSQRWSRVSIGKAATVLRTWFRHCETMRWAKPGLADTIQLPRIYRHEGLPLGPTWDQVGRMLAETAEDGAAQLRDRAIILLTSVYGLRSGEVRRLRLEDLDWQREQIRIIRSKSSRQEQLPLEPSVGNAITRYLRYGRPKSTSRFVFLTLLAPYRPLSAGGLYGIVQRRLSRVASPKNGRGPHGLRHACARHLVESGHSFKEVGDHLGHRSPGATRIYAKVDLKSLRLVVFDDLGGLA